MTVVDEAAPLAEATRLLHREARLLDAGRFEDWLDLFTPDGIYWIPSRPAQTDARGVASIIYEDRDILSLRVRRLREARAHALSPMPRTTHLVGNIDLLEGAPGGGALQVESALVVVEDRSGEKRIYSGRCTYELRRSDGVWRIAKKRVDLIDCDAIHNPIGILL